MQLINTILKIFLAVTLLCGMSSFINPEKNDISGFGENISVNDFQLTQADNYKRESILYTKQGEVDLAVESIRNYILATGDFTILENNVYDSITSNEGFINLIDQYDVKIGVRTFFYIYVGLIGIFIALVLNLRRRTDKVANGLIGLFVFIHSFFLLHVSLYLTNYVYQIPHSQSVSTIFSFMYGPILYFYFLRITKNYTFKKSDLVHLLPTLGFIIVFMPIYSLSSQEKLELMLGVGQYEPHPYKDVVSIIKLISLLVYGYFTIRLYLKNYKTIKKQSPKKAQLQRIIVIMHGVYAFSYGIYANELINAGIGGFLFEIQLVAMTTFVLYIGYIAYANPQVLVGTIHIVNKEIIKYKNSGLTTSFSTELKEELVRLLEVEKVYRQNSIKLETIAERLGTTRHNASQVINEHFNLNFFELINKYRVEEAMQLLKSNKDNLNIIDIAYEVGYNNKVTFNKSFKRFSNLTPSQFMKLEGSIA